MRDGKWKMIETGSTMMTYEDVCVFKDDASAFINDYIGKEINLSTLLENRLTENKFLSRCRYLCTMQSCTATYLC